MTHPQYSADIEDVADIIRDKVYADENDKVGGVYDAAQKVIEYITAFAAKPPTAPVETSTPAGMSRHDARSLVFDLLDAARRVEKADTASIMEACEYYDEMRDRVISALSGIDNHPHSRAYNKEHHSERIRIRSCHAAAVRLLAEAAAGT